MMKTYNNRSLVSKHWSYKWWSNAGAVSKR